jgi:sulfur dioxygenase
MKRHSFLVSMLAFMVALTFVGVGCQKKAKVMTAQDMVAEAKKCIESISAEEAKALFDKGGYTVLDCRTAKEYKMGHVPGATNIPRGLLEFKIDKAIPDKATPIVMYCKSGGRGSLGTRTLCSMGYTNVMNMDGGWMAWEKAGYPVE